jgi:multidrug resistance efflux pump
MFVRKFVIPLLAIAGAGFAAWTVASQNKPITPARPVTDPASSPYVSTVSGAGIIEPSTRDIGVGAHVPGVVMQVFVKEGDVVKAGDPLFVVDDRSARSDLLIRQAAVASAQAQLAKLQQEPRAEDIPPRQARVLEQQALLEDARSQLARYEAITDKRAITEDELLRKRYAVLTGEARVKSAQADLDLVKAGAWKPDMTIAQAAVDSAIAQLEAAKVELERHTVRAPSNATVLRVNIRAGEYALAGVLATPLMTLGDVQTLHVRCDVDENDAYRLTPGARAVASLRGNSAIKTDLTFVRVDPYVIPKRSLTGDSAERVDTRVLQVIYSFKAGAMPAYVGQQVDVKIEAPARETASDNKSPSPRGAM